MNNIANGLTLLLVVALAATSVLDFMRHAKAYEVTRRLQIPDDMVPVLGAVKSFLAIGLLVGTDYVRIAEFVGLCLIGYFAVAVLTHVRVKDGAKNAFPAFAMLSLSGLYLLATVAK